MADNEEDLTHWAEDDDPESLVGEDADDELGADHA